MQETIGDIFNQQCDAFCFISNGILNSKNELVMGPESLNRSRISGLCCRVFLVLVSRIVETMYIVFRLVGGKYIVSYPTKHHWKDPSDLALIKQSALELVALTDKMEWKIVYLVKPGCANGGLARNDVKSIIAPILDDRFIIIDYRK